MSVNTYDIGDIVRLEASFSDLAGTAVDPATVTFKVREPDGTLATIDDDVVQDATGLYHADFEPDQPGRHFWRVEGTGDGQAAEEGRFDVRASPVLAAEA